jgi:hypothetical protein
MQTLQRALNVWVGLWPGVVIGGARRRSETCPDLDSGVSGTGATRGVLVSLTLTWVADEVQVRLHLSAARTARHYPIKWSADHAQSLKFRFMVRNILTVSRAVFGFLLGLVFQLLWSPTERSGRAKTLDNPAEEAG